MALGQIWSKLERYRAVLLFVQGLDCSGRLYLDCFILLPKEGHSPNIPEAVLFNTVL